MNAENLIGFENIPQTIPHFCIESFRRNNKPDALAYKLADTWNRISGLDAIARIKRIALGLSALGVKAGDRVAIISENRPEWSLVDLAILSLRAVNVPIYTTQAVEQIRFILENSGAKMLFVSGQKLCKHAEEAIRSVERLEKLIFFDKDAVPENEQPCDQSRIESRTKETRRLRSTDVRRRTCEDRTGRSRDDHLHVGHDRRAEGRDADARQFCLEHRRDLKRPADTDFDRPQPGRSAAVAYF